MTRSELLTLLTSRISSIRRSRPVRVAIDGPDTAGKTTLANELAPLLDRPVIRAGIDGFHRPRAERMRFFEDSFDNAALVSHLLAPLAAGERYRTAIFDYRADQPVHSEPEQAAPDSVLLFDGIFLLRDDLREHWDLRIYLHVSEEEILRRALVRDVEAFGSAEIVRERYTARYLPGQRLYRERARPLEHAELVIDNTDPAQPMVIRS